MPRSSLLVYAAAGLLAACNTQRPAERLALDTSLTPVPLAAAASAAPIAPPSRALGVSARADRPTLTRETDAEVDPRAAKTILLWARDGHGRTLTYHLDRSGAEIEQLDGVYIGTRAGGWKWREENVAVPTKACEYLSDDGFVVKGEAPPPGSATRVTMVQTAPGTREQRIVDPLAGQTAEADPSTETSHTFNTIAPPNRTLPDDEQDDLLRDAEDVRHTVTLTGSIGAYLFLEESTYAYTCGAHGNTTVSARIWNVAAGSGEPMPADFGPVAGLLTRAAQELTEEDDPFPATDESLELTALVPNYGVKGAVRLGLQFTAPTCYACTRGGYGSYTKSTVLEATALPKLFARYAEPPGPVRRWIAAHPDERLGGYSGLAW